MIRGSFSVAIAFLIVGLPAAYASAQDMVIRGTNFHHNVKWHSVDIGDVTGHFVGVHENKGVSLYTSGERLELTVTGSVNWTNGSGPLHGYDIRKYSDGSILTLEYTGVMRSTPEGSSGEGRYVSCRGTGRFESVKCDGTWKGGRQGPSLSVIDWEVKLMQR